jgi:hypothetical protein
MHWELCPLAQSIPLREFLGMVAIHIDTIGDKR